MFKIVTEHFKDWLDQGAARMVRDEYEEVGVYERVMDILIRDHAELEGTLIRKLNSVNLELFATRTRAARNGALALLAFGLIAIEILGLALYFLPK